MELWGDSPSPAVPVGAIPGITPTTQPHSPLVCSRPSSYPTLPASARMATDTTAHTCRHVHTHTHTHAQSQTFESDFWPISPPKIPAGQLSCVSVSRLCLWVGPWGRLPFFRLQFSVQLETSLPTHPHAGAMAGRPLGNRRGSGGSVGESPFPLPSRRFIAEHLYPTRPWGTLNPIDTSFSMGWVRTPPHLPTKY